MKTLLSLLAACALSSSLFAEELTDSLKGKLVKLDNNKLVAAGDDALADKKVIAIYYSAHWCPPCRQFTPELVKFYNETKKEHPEFELIFVSSDRSEKDMEHYMQWGKMPWLGLKHAETRGSELTKHAARGIPYMVVLDAEGKVLVEKGVGEDWMHPMKALPQISKLLESDT